MGKNSKIEWTNHTFNPWWGCVRVSAACKHCYAEAWAKRVGSKVWGAKAERRLFGNKHWLEPIKWNAEAKQDGQRRRVFCASMADIFEKRKELDSWRERLWVLINDTPDLDWLLLTKRPQHVSSMIPWGDKWPKSVWLGTTIENQEWADKRLPIFADIPAAVRFISAEPLLGPIDLEPWLESTIDWVIAGGESGPKARPSNPKWFREIMSQCVAKNVPFHFKQWGDWAPDRGEPTIHKSKRAQSVDGTLMVRLGKKAAGRHLDGAIWNELPNVG
jgi:protein gp37